MALSFGDVCHVRDKNSSQFDLCNVTREFIGQIELMTMLLRLERLLRIGLKLNSAVEMIFLSLC